MVEYNEVRRQIEFIVEVDKLKSVLRQTSPIGAPRRENSAEHSWQVTLCAILFEKHANEPVDLLRVIKMLIIHDVVEIDVGDVFHYSKETTVNLNEKEHAAAKRIFGLLANPLGDELLSLWLEFEARQSPEAMFASAIDRVIAFVMNAHNEGGTWKKFNISKEDIFHKNAHIKNGSNTLWAVAQEMVRSAFA